MGATKAVQIESCRGLKEEQLLTEDLTGDAHSKPTNTEGRMVPFDRTCLPTYPLPMSP